MLIYSFKVTGKSDVIYFLQIQLEIPQKVPQLTELI